MSELGRVAATSGVVGVHDAGRRSHRDGVGMDGGMQDVRGTGESGAPATTAGAAAPQPGAAEGRRTEPMDVRRELLLEESTANERMIALWRLILCLVAAVYVSMRLSAAEPFGGAGGVLLSAIFFGVFYSATLFVLIHQRGYSSAIGFGSVAVDVTLISGALIALVLADRPLLATNNGLSAPLYLLVIMLAGLRYNPFVTVFATGLSLCQYAGVLALAWFLGDLGQAAAGSIGGDALALGRFEVERQVAQTLLVGAGGLITTFSVRRARDLRTASIVDALTQVFNRGFFDERLQHEFARAQRYERELSIVMVDVDHFKHYNDRNGHAAGDQVLKEVADILRFGVRSTDTVARYGGEEFVALLPETDKERAAGLAERIRQQIERHGFLYADQQPGGRLTISAGVATYPADGATPQALFEYADQALYKAKAAGRNRVRT